MDKYEEAILNILDPGYEEYDSGITLYAGYTDGNQNRPLVALKNDSDPRLGYLKDVSEQKNYFLFEDQARAVIEPRVPDIEGSLPQGAKLYRSRIGYTVRATPLFGWGDERHYRPYETTQISAPPPILASAGRMNREGVSFLYLASDADTAIAETRPHPGHYCSYAQFEATRELRVADLSAVVVTDYASSDKRLDEYLLLKTLDDLFSIPVTPDRRSEYLFTQLIADCFRKLGFDAIQYRSSVGEGHNLVVFNPELFAYIDGSSRVVKIESLSYRCAEMSLMGDDNKYMTSVDGSFI